MKIFVYGTLMRGEGNHSLLSNGSTQFLGEAVTKRGFTLYDLGAFPGMVKGGNGAVIGEIYEVTKATLAHLDYFRGSSSILSSRNDKTPRRHEPALIYSQRCFYPRLHRY